MFKFLKTCIILSLLLGGFSVFGQGTSNKGKDFWVAYQGVRENENSFLTLFITSTQNAVVNVTAGGQALPSAINIAAGQAVPVVIAPKTYTNSYIVGSDVTQEKAGIHITSDVDIIVYAHISIAARSASSLILPVKALGNEYYSISYIQSGGQDASEFSIVGVEDNTVVDIKPVANSVGNTRLANTPFQITLNKGDVYQYKSPTDLTGSKITTVGGCKPIAVFSGSTFISYCEPGSTRNAGSGDPLYQQLFPVSAWGQNFVTAPFYNAQNGSSDIIRVQVSKDNTTIAVNGSVTSALGVNLQNPYPAGSVITFGAKVATSISSDKPVSVAQFQVTQGCNINGGQFNGDPEMTILNPIEQTLKDITVFSALRNLTSPPTSILTHYLNIILKTADIPTLKIDGVVPKGVFSTIDATYSFITEDVTASSNINPAHRIQCENGFIAIAYGYGNVESYAYLAGADLRNLNAGIEIFPTSGTIQANSLCVGEDYNIKLKLPYETSEIIWDFNNGAKIETITNPTPTSETIDGKTSYYYNYQIQGTSLQLAGNYNLKATVTNPAPSSCDAKEDVVSEFDVFNLPTAIFTVDKQQICKDGVVSFTDASIGNGKTIEKWFWDFGDPSSTSNISTERNPTHVYSNSGDYTVKLYVQGETGCASLVKQDVVIHVAKLPQANFSTAPVTCLNQSIQFTDSSIGVEGNIIKHEWDFGDPTSSSNTSNIKDPNHLFNELKTYNVTLKVTTDLGCENTITKPVKINAVPVPNFEMPDICLSDASATFTNTSTIEDGTDMQYVWNFGDENSTITNNTSTQKNPSHVYTEAAVYNVSLKVISAAGCVFTITKEFTVNGSTPKAVFTVQNEQNLCSNQEVVFEDRASVDFGEVTKIEWIYDNSKPTEIETDNSPALRTERLTAPKLYKHLYPNFFSPATRDVTVIMKAYSGTKCVSTVSKLITLKAIPRALFTLPDGCLPNGEASFTNQSTFVGSETGLTYLWDFGDGSATSTDKNPVHKFNQAKDYQITLTVTAANGCTNTSSQIFTVKGAIPDPKFVVENESELCSDQIVAFTDNTKIAFGELSKIEWHFDLDNHPNDPAYQLIDDSPALRSATAKTYNFTYPTFNSPLTQIKKVRMRVMENGTCVSEVIKLITLKAVPNVVFTSLPNVCAEILPYPLTQASETTGFVGGGVYSGAGVNEDGVFSPARAGVGTHTITYTFIGDNGCSTIKTQTITVFATPTVDAGADKVILIGGETILESTATGVNLKYKWTPATGLSADDIANPIAAPKVDIIYTLTVTSDEGCVLADDVAVQVLKFPEIPNTFTPNGDGVNDTWAIKYLGSYPNSTVKIFNRYGSEVYFSQKYVPWDGKLNGNVLPEGMYYYIITAKDGELKYSGSLLLVK